MRFTHNMFSGYKKIRVFLVTFMSDIQIQQKSKKKKNSETVIIFRMILFLLFPLQKRFDWHTELTNGLVFDL